MISDLAISAGKPKATFLKEFLESSFHDVIDLFSLRSPLVATLDDVLASELGAQVMTQRYGSHFVTRWNREYQNLLGISTEEELRRMLLNNTPYLRTRAVQVLKGWSAIPRGISLTFALFAELAGRNRATIDQAWTSIFYSQLPEARHRFYRDIDTIRALKKQHAVADTARPGMTSPCAFAARMTTAMVPGGCCWFWMKVSLPRPGTSRSLSLTDVALPLTRAMTP